MVCKLLVRIDFDNTDEGTYRRVGARSPKITPEAMYDNRFVGKAMAEIK
jgi:hypothetical protein